MHFVEKMHNVLKVTNKLRATDKVVRGSKLHGSKAIKKNSSKLFKSGTTVGNTINAKGTTFDSKNSFESEQNENGFNEGRSNLKSTKLNQVQVNKLFEDLRIASGENGKKSLQSNTKTPTKGSGVVSFGIKQNHLPLGDALEPLTSNIVTSCHTFGQQSAYAHQMPNSIADGILNVAKGNVSTISKRMESIHSDRKILNFQCPLPSKKRKNNAKNKVRKMDCASLKAEALANNVIVPPKSIKFVCKTRKSDQPKEPNACGVVFQCPKKEKPKEEDTCKSSISVSLIKDQFCRHANALLDVLFTSRSSQALCSELVEEAVALAMMQINPIGFNAAHCSNKIASIFETVNPQTVQVRNISKGPKTEILYNLAAPAMKMPNVRKYHSRNMNNSKLRISDAELKRISVGRKPTKAAEITMTGHILTSPAQACAKSEGVEKSGNAEDGKPKLCNNEQKEGVGQSQDDKQVAKTIDCSTDKIKDYQSKSSSSVSSSCKTSEFQPQPGQICCPKGDEVKEVVILEEKKQICCPPKDKSKKTVTSSSPSPPPSPKSKEEKAQAAAALQPKPSTGYDPSKNPLKDEKKPTDSKSKEKGNAVKEDPNVFNCCLSIVGERQVEINNCPMPELTDHNVIIKMHTVGLCSSDVFMFDKGPPSKEDSSSMAIGHEGSGIVYKVGKKVKHLKPGDGVAIEPGIACNRCTYCKAGRCNLCSKMKFHSLLQTYCAHPGHYCYKVPKSMNLEHAALTHPVSLGLYACRRGNISVGSQVLILGACPVGLASVMSARALGADKIAIIDTLEKNLKVAYELCADKTILATHELSCEELADKVVSEMKGKPTVVIDCCGCTKTINLSLLALKHGGSFVMAGCQAECANLPILAAMAKEICICSSFRTSNEFSNSMSLIESRRANVEKLITHRSEFCDAQEAFDIAVDEEKSGAIKVLVNWPHTVRR